MSFLSYFFAHKTPKVYKIRFFPSASKSTVRFFFSFFSIISDCHVFLHGYFLYVSASLLCLSVRLIDPYPYVTKLIWQSIAENFRFYTCPRALALQWFYIHNNAMPSTFPRNGILDVKTICYRDRGGGGAGRAAAPPLFCAPAPTFCAEKKNN